MKKNTETAETWDLIIEPNHTLLQLKLAEIWRYRDLLYLFIRRDIVSFYKQTILGPIWFFVQPLLTTVIYVIVFGNIANLSTDGTPQVMFYMTGIIMWGYFSDCLNKTATVFKDNAGLFGKVYFPRLISPLSIVIANLARLGMQFALLGCFSIWYFAQGKIAPNIWLLFFPLMIATMATISLALGMLVSATTTKYRDLAFLLQFGVQLAMYATPVIYPSSQVPSSISSIVAWNPISPLFEVTRYGLLGQGQFTLVGIAYSIVFALLMFVFATIVFNQVERNFMDTI